MNNTPKHQALRFVVVGVATTALHFIILHIFYIHLGKDIITSSIAAFAVAVMFSYSMSYRFIFRSEQQHLRSAPKFLLSVGIGFAWNVGLMYLLVERMHTHYLLAFLLTTSAVMINNFLLTKLWVFKS